MNISALLHTQGESEDCSCSGQLSIHVLRTNRVAAVRYARAAIKVRLIPQSEEYNCMAQAQTMRHAVVADRTALMEAIAERLACRMVTAGIRRGTVPQGNSFPPGIGGGSTRYAGTATVFRHGRSLDLASLTDNPLELTISDERERLAELIGGMTKPPWTGFGASLATKTLHKKRPDLVPILHNQAIFGGYMNPRWPRQLSSTETIKSTARIREALNWIAQDLTRPENTDTWSALAEGYPHRSLIELLDCVWWIYFRQKEPVPVTVST